MTKHVASQGGRPENSPERIRALLIDAKAKKAELLEQAARYKETHQLERFTPHPRQQLFFDALKDPAIKTYVLLGGNRCLAPDERIFNPLTGQSTRIKELQNGPHHVFAWDSKKGRLVPALALPSFPKGEDQMYRVTLSDGRAFESSSGHLILTPDGYRPVSELRPQSAVFLPPSSSGTFQSVRGASDPSSEKRVRDCRDGCSACSDPCDELLQHRSAGGPASRPSPDGVQVRIDHGPSGARANTRADSRSCRSSDPLSIPGALRRFWDQCAELVSSALAGAGEQSAFRPCYDTPQASQQFGTVARLQRASEEEIDLVPGSKCSQACDTSLTITTITPTRRAVKWDFAVPFYNNYFHQGIIHHNSGKTECAVAAAVSLAMGRLPWIPLPQPLPAPTPLRTAGHPDGSVTITLSADTRPYIETLGQIDGWQDVPFQPSDDGRLSTTGTPDAPKMRGRVKKPSGPMQALQRTFPSGEAYKRFLEGWSQPPDPGRLRFNPPTKIRLLAEDMTALEQVQIPKLRKYVAPEWIVAKKKNSFGVETHWIFANGSVIDLLTFQQDSAMMEGWDGHVCLYDEPPPRSHYIANIRGLVDHNGISIFSMTPLKEAWIADEIVNKPDNTIWTMTMNSRENPHVSKSAMDEFESKLTEEERETRIGGKFLHLQGLVFKKFDKVKHVVPPFDIPPNYTCYASVDTHPRTEQAVAFMAVDPRGNHFVVSESFRHETPDQVADRLIDFHRNTHKLELVLIEPASKGDENRGESTFTVIDNRLAEEGICLELGSKDLSGGILMMQDALMSKNNLASLFFFRNCERTIWEIQRYVWKDWKNAGGKDKTEMNKPKDADDHLIECIRRLIQHPADYVQPRQASEFLQRTWQPRDPEAGY